MKKLVLFGAGNIGRSFIGERFASAGYEVVFVDVDQRLVEALNERGAYRVIIKHNDGHDEVIEVTGVRAVDGRDVEAVAVELLDAEIAATSVGMAALPRVAPVLAAGLRGRAESGAAPIDVILAENIRDAADRLRRALVESLAADAPEVRRYLSESVGLVETSIGKMVPLMTDEDRAVDPLWVFAEPYNTLIVDAGAFRRELPAVDSLKPVQSIQAYVDRKLFIHNLGHAAVAYFGFRRHPDAVYVYEALADSSIRDAAREAMRQSAEALHAEYTVDLSRGELDDHIDDLLCRFSNRSLKDTIFRVGRDVPRKLGRDDRIIGAALLAAGHGVSFDRVAEVAASAMQFRSVDEHGRLFPPDAEFVRRYGDAVERILDEVCGLAPDGKEEDRIVRSRILDACSRLAGG